MSAPARYRSINAEVDALTRKGRTSVLAIAETVYAGRPAPRDPVNTVRSILCALRKRGRPIHIHRGVVTVGTKSGAVPLQAGRMSAFAGHPLSKLEVQVVGILREFGPVPLSSRDIADEAGKKRSNDIVRVMRKVVAKGLPIDQVGGGYRLARFTRDHEREVHPC